MLNTTSGYDVHHATIMLSATRDVIGLHADVKPNFVTIVEKRLVNAKVYFNGGKI